MQKYLTRKEAAEFLTERGMPISWRSLGKFATRGGGPTYRIFGFRALYRPDDLLEWAEGRMSEPRENTAGQPARSKRVRL